VAPDKGRFRSFLLAALKHFLINEWDRSRTIKRGGAQTILSLDFESAEGRYRNEPYHVQTAERLFDRQWALTILECVRDALRQEAREAGQADRFERIQAFLTGDKPSAPYSHVAEELGMSEAAVKMAVSRLRRRFHDRLRQEIGQTVHTDADIEDEIRDLILALQA
jgi:RNA polymerase sigma-70 factor (ECF subfamily)